MLKGIVKNNKPTNLQENKAFNTLRNYFNLWKKQACDKIMD